MRGIAVMLTGLLAPAAALGQQPGFFYRGLEYGSEAAFLPGTAILHSGFFNFQIDNRGDNPFVLPYAEGLENVARNLSDPIGAISRFGWGRFLTTEILPNASRNSGQWVPNYFGHVLGEGLVYRYLAEWYEYHGYPHSRLLGVLTMSAGALLNEVVENGAYQGANVDPIADFYIFNPLGVLVFSSDRIVRFLSGPLHMTYWPRQAAYDPFVRSLENVGYRTVFKVRPGGRGSPLGVFASYGSQGFLGATYWLDLEHALSVAGGVAARDLVEVPDTPAGSRAVTATLGPAFGAFLDRNNSLLASIVVTPQKREVVAVNLYPGVIGRGRITPGFSAAWDRDAGFKLSVHLSAFPLGLAARIN